MGRGAASVGDRIPTFPDKVKDTMLFQADPSGRAV